MLNSNLNLEDAGITIEELTNLLSEATSASEDLRSKLSSLKIKISGAKDPNIITAISNIFGSSYITTSGDSYITYDMYCSVINLIRKLGTTKAEELL